MIDLIQNEPKKAINYRLQGSKNLEAANQPYEQTN
jgi:hypothetical protein